MQIWKHGRVHGARCVVTCMIINSEGEGGTPLSCAASEGHKDIVNYLLGQDVDVNGGMIKSKVL